MTSAASTISCGSPCSSQERREPEKTSCAGGPAENDPVLALGELHCREAVEDVGAHMLRIALERISVAGGVRDRDLKRVVGLEPERGHLRRPVLLFRGADVANHGGVDAVVAPKDPP